MPRFARIYIGSIICLGFVFSSIAVQGTTPSRDQWILFVTLTLLATLTQLNQVNSPHQVYQIVSPIFFFTGVLLLYPLFLVLLITIPHVVEWVQARLTHSSMLQRWYIQPFNIAKSIIAASIAQSLYQYSATAGNGFTSWQFVFVTTIVALAYVLVNDLLLGTVLVLASNISWRESGMLRPKSWLPDLILTYCGMSVAVQWITNPWLIVPALAPLVLVYRALKIPQLEYEAQVDAKTGLANARHFKKTFSDCLDRAQRHHKELSLIMADLDFLRNVNNTYGHLAGDIVLEGIGRLIRSTIRPQDIAGRFGGEEFCIVLPGTSQDEAELVAERVRATIEGASFAIAGVQQPLRVTMSLGIACFPHDAVTTTDLLQAADFAVYEAKRQGRNRVVTYHEGSLHAAAQAIKPSIRSTSATVSESSQ